MAGNVNIVELTDFDCEHCARADQIMQQALRGAKDIHFVRIPAPMPRHVSARPAARAYLASLKPGKGGAKSSVHFAAHSRKSR